MPSRVTAREKENYRALDRDPGIALLIDVANSEAKMRSDYRESQPYTLLNPNTGQEETWLSVSFPADKISQYDSSRRNWPEGWPWPGDASGSVLGIGSSYAPAARAALRLLRR